MNRIKIFISMISIISVLLLLCGCASVAKPKVYSSVKELCEDVVVPLIDTSLYTLDDEDETFFVYDLIDENATSDLQHKITLGDCQITLPVQYGAVKEMGWEADGSSESQISPLDKIIVEAKNSSQQVAELYIKNQSQATIDINDGLVCSVELAMYDIDEKLDDCPEFLIDDSISNTSTMKEVIEKLGAPYRIYCDQLDEDIYEIGCLYSSQTGHLSIVFFGDGSRIGMVDYSNYPQDNTPDFSKDWKWENGVYNNSFLGLSFKTFENWSEPSNEELTELQDEDYKNLNDSVKEMYKDRITYACWSTSEDKNSSFSICYEDAKKLEQAKGNKVLLNDYVEETKNLYNNMFKEARLDSESEIEFCGKAYKRLEYSIYTSYNGGGYAKRNVYFCELNGQFVTITIHSSAFGTITIDDMVARCSALK